MCDNCTVCHHNKNSSKKWPFQKCSSSWHTICLHYLHSSLCIALCGSLVGSLIRVEEADCWAVNQLVDYFMWSMHNLLHILFCFATVAVYFENKLYTVVVPSSVCWSYFMFCGKAISGWLLPYLLFKRFCHAKDRNASSIVLSKHLLIFMNLLCDLCCSST